MSYILSKPYTSKEYADMAVYCNSNNAHIEDKGGYLEAIANPLPPEPTREELAQIEIARLEALQTPRLYREAIAGEEYAIKRLAEIDALIAEQREIIKGGQDAVQKREI